MAERIGDPFRGFFDRALPVVYGYLHTRLGDTSAAERATRDAFAAIVPHWPLPANVKHEVAHAVGFARLRLADEYRRQDQHVKRRRQFAVTSSSAAAHRTTAAVDLRVHWAMVAVPGTQRAALVLRRVDDLSLREVAAIIGRAPRVTEFIIRRGSRTLRRALKAVDQTDGFDPLAAMKGLDGPVEPPETFKEELYDELRAALDQSAVGAPEPEAAPRAVPQRIFLIAAIALASILLLAGILSGSGDSTDGPDRTVEPLPLSEPDPPEHNADPAVISPPTSRSPLFEPIRPPARSLGGYQFGGWTVLPASEFDGREGAAVAWTGEQLFVWGGRRVSSLGSTPAQRGGMLNPGVDVWFSVAPAPIAPRSGASAIWTGTEILVLGGDSQFGAAYDPATRLWRELAPAPLIVLDDVAVWTGTEVILVGPRSSGLAYSAAEDTWRVLEDGPRDDWEIQGAVWTGAEMIVWSNPVVSVGGSRESSAVGAYDPVADSWRQVAPPDDSFELLSAGEVWTGEELIFWGIESLPPEDSGTDWSPIYGGMALNPATDEWRLISPPPDAGEPSPWGPERTSAVWTGSRMLMWRQGFDADRNRQEIWAYDPAADMWERGASSPVASSQSLIWTGDTLYAYGGGDRLFRTLSLDLGPDGDELPDPVGTEIVTYAHPPLPFELLAVAANSGRAAVIDLEGGVARVYESTENLLPPDVLDGAAPVGNGWVTTANGAVWSYPNGIASQPFVLQSGPTVERPGLAPSVFALPARGDPDSGWVWIVEPGSGGSDDPSLVSQVSLDNGRTITTASVAGGAYPVASTAAGLLLNVSGTSGPKIALVMPDGSVRELWPGWGLGLSSLGRVTWLECDEEPGNCQIVVSMLDGRAADDRVIEDSGFGAVIQPGVSQVSPDGGWLVTTRGGAVDADSPLSVVLANLRDGSVTELLPGVPLGARPGPGVVWSEDSEWVLISAAGPTAIRVADGLAVELNEWIPADMQLYAVASR